LDATSFERVETLQQLSEVDARSRELASSILFGGCPLSSILSVVSAIFWGVLVLSVLVFVHEAGIIWLRVRFTCA